MALVQTKHKVSGTNKTDKPNINDNTGANKNVNDIKAKKKCETNSKITNGKQERGDIGVKDNHIPFNACHQLFVSGK